MTNFAVSEEKNRWLRERMAAVGLREEDMEERFVRSSGAGGQHVNKTATCIWLRHRPTGLEVKCMAERSQSLNRFLARREMAEKLAAFNGLPTTKDDKADKLRRQKARRKRKATTKYTKPEIDKDSQESP
ncbi:peptide chain release factor family protein [Geomobilimonas luticola]|uniref:Peptide chain release factor-like protein n=1 Tax=Geomobilimonas luticola TaxID=1114878 RepID=A0ABS5SDP2_9BACT|nr:peptide chain release factor-like protein [Geomobilimonas luticola]MBT0652726.1 peptide chain release factor-like protein [Geomobilimonas luticola]